MSAGWADDVGVGASCMCARLSRTCCRGCSRPTSAPCGEAWRGAPPPRSHRALACRHGSPAGSMSLRRRQYRPRVLMGVIPDAHSDLLAPSARRSWIRPPGWGQGRRSPPQIPIHKLQSNSGNNNSVEPRQHGSNLGANLAKVLASILCQKVWPREGHTWIKRGDPHPGVASRTIGNTTFGHLHLIRAPPPVPPASHVRCPRAASEALVLCCLCPHVRFGSCQSARERRHTCPLVFSAAERENTSFRDALRSSETLRARMVHMFQVLYWRRPATLIRAWPIAAESRFRPKVG